MVFIMKIYYLKYFFFLKLDWIFEIYRCFFYLFILIICNFVLFMGLVSDLFNGSIGIEGEFGL